MACTGFLVSRYALDNAVMAPYALFGAVALGMLSQIPGSPAERARTLLAVLPVGWLLVTLGTLLSVSTAAATAGMFVLGFVVSFVGVGGPRLVGLAAGAQLLYILPCFPPYDPGSLGWRLAGVTLAVLLLAGAELVLWPDPTPEPYTAKLGRAVDALAGCLTARRRRLDGPRADRDRLAALLPEAGEAADALRPSRSPPMERPASAGRRDRALTIAAATARLLLGRAVDLHDADARRATGLPAAAALLRQAASCAEAAAAWLRAEGRDGAAVPDTDRIAAALAAFRADRAATPPDGVPPERLRLNSLALSLGEWTKSLVAAVRVAAGAPIGPAPPRRPPGRARCGSPTSPPRGCGGSACASTSPRGRCTSRARCGWLRRSRWPGCWPGVLDLSHGFWVLLTILTLLRASAAETRSLLWPALVGTVVGSVLAAALLVAGIPPTAFALVLPLVMLVGFAAGPLLGLGWAQALFTLVIALVFAQVSPVDWHLAEARVVDVAVGAAIGLATGLLAWPRGGSGELHRAAGRLPRRRRPGRPGDRRRPRPRRPSRRGAAAGAGRRRARAGVVGAVPDRAPPAGRPSTGRPRCSPGTTPSAAPSGCCGRAVPDLRPAALRASALDRSAVRTTSPARYEPGRRRPRCAATASVLTAAPPDPPRGDWPTNLGTDLYHLADLHVWLDGLRDDLGRIPATRRRVRANRPGAGGRRPRDRLRSASRWDAAVRVSTLAYMESLTVSEARARLPEILDRVEAGEEITITRHGRPGRRAAAAGHRACPGGVRAPSTGRGRSAGCWRRPGIARSVLPR